MKTKIQQQYSGIGSIHFLENILTVNENPFNIFLVTGNFFYQSSLKDTLEPLLASYDVTHFNDFSANPQLDDVRKGISLFKEKECDLVLAIGGGSTLDIAKSINILTAQIYGSSDKVTRYITKELSLKKPGKPFIAVPTTAGTGSEATHFAVVYIDKKKYSLAHPEWMLPDYVVLDPSLTYNLPAKITASTGMDALCQAIESYWSVYSTEESQQYAGEAIPLIWKNLPVAVNNPTPLARESMMKAANLAGKAINISKTTACHAISYPFTSYFNVPHGHAVALTLGEMFVYNAGVNDDDCLDGRGLAHTQKTMQELMAMAGVTSPDDFNHQWCALMDTIGLERRLHKLGLTTEEDIDLIVKNGFNPERVRNNLRVLTERELKKILYRIS
ncbi:MAG: phosphonoacetaldehyde reductase [Nanoarchaeota archaeon]|nr:phosphonoacetaldehyde reductase [Nanoarchaeota archaeon]